MKYIILGIIQGLTEFIPVSSSAHLVIAKKLLNIIGEPLPIIVFAHFGTVLALFFYFFKDILEILRCWQIMINIIVANLVTAVCALIFRSYFESLFGLVWMAGIALIINGIIIFVSYFFSRAERQMNSLKIRESLVFGFIQALAIIPGISRSGITITYLLSCGIEREGAFRFSFLAGIPAIMGAFILEGGVFLLNTSASKGLLLCILVSFLSGVFSLWVLKRFLNKKIFHYFGYYCIAIGILFIFIR